jgi:spermidine synthase
MAYEVIWTRLLGLIIGPTTYSFTIVLSTFIIGLALGSLIFGWFADKTKKPLGLLIFTQLVAALLALGVSQLLGNSQFLFAKLIYHFKDHFYQLAMLKAVILFGLMLGPTLCLGATFPLVGKIYTQSLATVGRSIGFAYAINTLGAVLGSFCAGFLLIPWLGKEQSLSLVIGIQLLSSLVIGGYFLWGNREHITKWIPLSATALIGLMLCFNLPYWNRHLLSQGKYYRIHGALSSELKSSGWLETLWMIGPKILPEVQSNSELSYYGDGIGGFTTVMKIIDVLGISEYVLLNSGKGDASSRTDMPTQTLSAHLPLLFHPNPKEIMVLGLASGITAGEVLHYPIERLDIIEISEQVVSASNFFIPWNNKVLSHPKTELIIQDGRAHLELTKRRYDVIISEPSNPWMAGLASLFTREFFLLAKERLNEDGIFVQFFHTYQMDWPTFALVGRTFSQVFPNNLLMTTYLEGTDYLMIGFKGGNRLIVNNADKKISYAHQSKNITLPNSQLLYRLIISEDLKKLCGSGPVHSDNWPRLEFAAPKKMYKADPNIETNIRSKRWLSQGTRIILREIANVEDQIAFETFALSVYKPSHNMVNLSKATFEQKERFFRIMEDYCARLQIKDYSIFTNQEMKERCLSVQIETIENNIHLVPDKTVAYNHLGYAYHLKGELLPAIDCYQKALATNPESITAYINLGKIYFTKGMIEESISAYQKALAINPNDVETRNNLGGVLLEQGKLDEAIEHFKKCIATKPDDVGAHNNLGIAYTKKDMSDKAIKEFERALIINPNFAMAHSNLGNIYVKKGELDKAITAYKRAIAIKADYASAHNSLAVAYYYKENYKLAIIHCDKAVELGVSIDPKLLELLKPYR